MKKIFVLLLCACTIPLLAQETTPTLAPAASPTFQHEIGFDAIRFVNEILRFGNSNATSNAQYIFNYRYFLKERHALRFGVGGTLNADKFQQEGFTDLKRTMNYNANLRLGYEYRYTLHPSLRAYVGGDILFNGGRNALENESGFDIVRFTTNSFSVGIGPVLGLQYYITPRFWIGTETALYYQFGQNVVTRIFVSNPSFNDGQEITQFHRLDPQPPLSLFVGWKF